MKYFFKQKGYNALEKGMPSENEQKGHLRKGFPNAFYMMCSKYEQNYSNMFS